MRMMLGVADERGAVLAMFAVMLVVILGMVALVIDVGAIFVTKRQLVAAADSASLAAAQSCALEDGEAEFQADTYAGYNKGEANRVSFTGCEGSGPFGTVGGTYQAPAHLSFASVLGFGEVATIDASATSLWGPTQRAEPMPVIVSINDPESCSPCALWLDPSVSGEFMTGDQAGLVDLERWSDGRCRSSFARLYDWISGSQLVEPVSLPATPCALTSADPTQLIAALLAQTGKDKLFPVATSFTPAGNSGRFSAVGFAPLRIEDAALPSQGFSNVECDVQPQDHTFEGPGATHSINGEVLACILAHEADTITVQLSKPGPCCSPDDYTFNPDTNVITWHTEETNNVEIEISWSKLPNFAGCQEGREVTGDQICLILSWQGPRVGGSNPAEDGANDYGYRAVRLTE